MNTQQTCTICDCELTKVRRTNIECPFAECMKSSCKECFIKFISGCEGNPTCMWCKRDLSIDFISRVAGVKVAKEIQKIKALRDVELYQSQLPLLQDRVVSIRRQREYKRNKHEALEEFTKLHRETNKDYYELRLCPYLSLRYNQVFPKFKGVLENIRDWLSYRCHLCEYETIHSDYRVFCDTCGIHLCVRCTVIVNAFCSKGNMTCYGCSTKHSEYNQKCIRKHTVYCLVKEAPSNQIIKSLKSKIGNTMKCIDIAYKFKLENPIEYTENHAGSTGEDNIRKQFIKKCPTYECRGYLSTAWKCPLCEEFFCSKCHQKKGEDHECSKEDVETAEYLKKETKPCPRCQMPISRIDGCDQVWTPCCKIAFNWKTGRIETGVIHSPEYYAYLRRFGQPIPRQQGDVVGGDAGGCNNEGRLVIADILRRHLYAGYDQVVENMARECHTIYLAFCNQNFPILDIDNTKSGVSYILGDITREQWTCHVYKESRARERSIKLRDIYQTYITVMADMLTRLFGGENYLTFLEAHRVFATYTNQELDRVYTIHGLKNKTHRIVTNTT
jgi:hypothetical protein